MVIAGPCFAEVSWGSQVVAFEVGLRGQARELRFVYRYLLTNRSDLHPEERARRLQALRPLRRGYRFSPEPAWRAFVHIARRH
jgi:hypothetical protein